MRTPTRHLRAGGVVAYKVRFRLRGEDSSITFKGLLSDEKDIRAQADAFARPMPRTPPACGCR